MLTKILKINLNLRSFLRFLMYFCHNICKIDEVSLLKFKINYLRKQKTRVSRFYVDLGLNLGSSVKELHSKKG